MESNGGWTCLGTGGPSCGVPHVVIPLPSSVHPADATLELASGAYHQSFAFGDTLAPRSLELVGATNGQFPAGQPVTVRYAPAADLDRFQIEVVLFRSADPDAGWAVPASEVTRNGDTLTVTPPAGQTGPGEMVVRLDGNLASGAGVIISAASASVTFTP